MNGRNPRKKRKLNNSNSKDFPKVYLNSKGRNAQLFSTDKTPLCYEDITNLILHASTPSSYQRKPYWCEVMRLKKLGCLSLIVIEDTGLNELLQCSKIEKIENNSKASDTKLTCLSNILSFSTFAVEVVPPKDDLCNPMSELYHIKSSEITTIVVDNCKFKSFYKGGDILREDLQLIFDTEDKFDRTKLLLSLKQLEMHQYPLLKEGKSVHTSRTYYSEVTSTSPMYAIDCEMVMTEGNPQELAQISVVDESLKVIYSTIVKPESTITNYLTYYSGLTSNEFIGVQTKIKDVQLFLAEILPPDAILVGHSLNCDLTALKISHPYCIDTSLIYNMAHSNRKRPSLKNVVKCFLDVDIQNSMKIGHDPTEDAISAMLLVKKKLATYLEFGDTTKGWIRKRDYTYTNSVHENTYVPKQNIFKIISKYSKKPTVLMKLQIKENILYNMENDATFINVQNDEDSFDRIKSLCMTEKLVISHIKIERDSKSLKNKLEVIDKQLKKLYDYLPLRCMLIIFFAGSFSVQDNIVSNGCAFITLKNSY